MAGRPKRCTERFPTRSLPSRTIKAARALARPRQHSTVPTHDDRPLQERRVSHHLGDQLIVGDLRPIQAELLDQRLAHAQDLAWAATELLEQPAQLVLLDAPHMV